MDLRTSFVNSTTSELISIFQNGDNPQNTRDSAFIVLCTRFRRELLEKCEIVCKRFGHGAVLAEQIGDITFTKYAEKPNFVWDKSKAKNCDAGFLLYLFGIAQNELTNYYRKEKRRQAGYDYDGTETLIKELPPIPTDRLDVETKVKHAAIESLPPRHKTVYLTYEVYQRKGFNLPKELLMQLREYLGTDKQSTVRGIKKEAVDKINAYVEAMNITKNDIDGRI